VLVAPLGSLLILLLRAFDEIRGADSINYISEKVKRSISWLLLQQCGIKVVIIGRNNQHFVNHEAIILSFSHASNLGTENFHAQ
jgi:hypothetical protein